MLAAFALSRLALEQRVALVAGPAHALHGLATDVVALEAGRHGERGQEILGHVVAVDGDGEAGVLLVLLGLLGREARALLAARVVAVGAQLVGAEGGLAAMALPVHAHHHLLLHPLRRARRRRRPLARLERHAVLCEQSARLLLA